MDSKNTKLINISLLFTLSIIFVFNSCLGCGPTSQFSTSYKGEQKKRFPNRSFVKVFRFVKIKECLPISGGNCKEGTVMASTGSGSVIISSKEGSLILTAGHVCNAIDSRKSDRFTFAQELSHFTEIQTTNNKYYNATIVHKKIKKGVDLCMLFVKEMKNHKTIKISKKAPHIGDRAYSISAPGGIFHPPAAPILSGFYSGLMTDSDSDMYTIPAIPGSSGSPVLNEDFELIGNIYAASLKFTHMSISTRYKDVKKFITKSIQIYNREKMHYGKTKENIIKFSWF